MPSFLHTVAADLYARYGDKISELTLVFPNKRAHLFFSKSLSQIIEKPLWQPTYKSIEELIAEASPMRVADTFTLIVELYNIYCKKQNNPEPFDRFYYWGETMLRDFDQLDKYLLNAAALFANLRDIKAFDGDYSFLLPEQVAEIRKFWDLFAGETENRIQQEFITMWELLFPIYEAFRYQLTASGIAYEGMIYRQVADSLANSDSTASFAGRYVFIGFNSLNECEKKLFHYLKTHEQADFYWDYDIYYTDNPQQEAGLFLRENIKNFPSPLADNNCSNFQSSVVNRRLSIVAAPSNIAQAKVVPQLLTEMNASPDELTAVVLADKQLLTPLLYTLPSVSDQINISMGYPLRQTAIYSLIGLLLQAFEKSKQAVKKGAAEETTSTGVYYYQDLLALVAHPYIKQLLADDYKTVRSKIISGSNVYISNRLFTDYPLLAATLAPIDNYRDLSNRLLWLVNELGTNELLIENDGLLGSYLQHITCQLNKLASALSKSTFEIPIKLYAKLVRTIFKQDTIPFTGEPLAGVQVVGLLETMAVDFDNVIVLSANEGILPPASQPVSFIPVTLRRGFGLPVPEQHESTWAYYFYRLLQRAKQVSLLYNTKTDGTSTGEASRYLLQLKMESGQKVIEKNLLFEVEIPENEAISVSKNPLPNSNHRNLCDINRLSPSALNAYIACSLRFYFQYIARIKEPDELIEKIDSRLFGTLLHKAMELVYRPFLKQEVTIKMLEQMLADTTFVENIVKQAIALEYYDCEKLPNDFRENGDLLIAYNILRQYVKQLLLIDKKQAPFVIEGLEVKVEQPLTLNTREGEKPLVFGGIVDRLHRKGNNWYVVDYKTGWPDNEFENISLLFDEEPKKQHAAILQTLLYSAIVQANKQQPVTPLLYFLRESHSDGADFTIFEKATKQTVSDVADYVEDLTEQLVVKLSELFDTQQPFTQTPHQATCEYCTYRSICNK